MRRIVRRVELWSVLKLSLIFYLCLWAVLLVAGVIVWNIIVSSGLVGRIEDFIIQIFGLESFAFDSQQIFRVYALGGLVSAFLATLFNVLAAILFNLISELVGGVADHVGGGGVHPLPPAARPPAAVFLPSTATAAPSIATRHHRCPSQWAPLARAATVEPSGAIAQSVRAHP